MSYIVKQEDLIGEIEVFPIEVVQKMIERQVEEDKSADVSVFQRKNDSGYSWALTEEKWFFWNEVIRNKNFDLFFERYPKQEQIIKQYFETTQAEPTFPRWMYVGDSKKELLEKNKKIALVLCKFLDKYFSITGIDKNTEEEEIIEKIQVGSTTLWNYAIPIPPKVKLTRAEIAEKFGIDPDFEIID